ncbi:MAG: aminotransferase class III-fold pyridoxal phosphate-dependent enzyme [Candidatus Micrarchaeaceae archaeon]
MRLKEFGKMDRPMLPPKVKKILERDKKVLLTTTRLPYPVVVSKGDGDYVYDACGKRYIDFTSFIAVYNFGAGSPKSVRRAVASQASRMMHSAFYDFYAEEPVAFAEKLLAMFPKGFGRVFFSNSGTEANEAALKFSKLFTKRQYTIAFYGAFHGRTMGSLGLTSSKAFQREHFGPFNSVIHVPYAYCYRCPLGKEYPSCGIECADYIRKNVLPKEASQKEVGAIFIEPIQGEGGYVVPPKEFIVEVRKIASENGILLVSDEVQSGYMRTGKFLALENFGVEADIYTMAKAVGGGLPLGVTVTRSSLGDIPEGAHANTFGGNLASIAAASATLDYVKRNQEALKEASKSKGSMIIKRLNEMKEKYEIIGDVRGIGMMIGIEIVRDKGSKEPGIEEHIRILKLCFERGLLLMPAGQSSLRIIPPLTMSRQNIEKGLDIIEEAVNIVNSEVASK